MLRSLTNFGAPLAVGLLTVFMGLATAQAPMNVITPPRGTPCTPEPGWGNCFVMADPKITVMSVDGVSEGARMAAANIYTQMTQRLSPKYPKAKFNGYKIYITNGKPWTALANLQPIGSLWPAKTGEMSGDWLRGGTTANYLWIDEQMICKTGVQTRGAKDKSARTYDQVIHEFAHAISYRYGLDARVNQTWPGDNAAPERFAWAVQYWFSSPAGADPKAQGLMSELFTSKASFSCKEYKP